VKRNSIKAEKPTLEMGKEVKYEVPSASVEGRKKKRSKPLFWAKRD